MADPRKLNLDSFRRPDGSLDVATLPNMPREELNALLLENDQLLAPSSSARSSHKQPAASPDYAHPTPLVSPKRGREEARLEALRRLEQERISSTVAPRLLGKFNPDAPENQLAPRPQRPGSFSDPAYQAKGRDPNARDFTPAELAREKELHDAPNLPVSVEEGVPENRWTPGRLGLSLEETRNNKSITDPGQPAERGVFSKLMDGVFNDPREGAQNLDPGKLDALRKEAAGSVGAMKADETEHNQDADFGRVEAKVASMDGPRAALQKFNAVRKPPPLETGSDLPSPTPDRPSFAEDPIAKATAAAEGGGHARQPLAGAQQMLMGAAPPDTSKDEAEMDAAAKARDNELLLAQLATNFGHYSDVLGGTQGPDRGAAIRENATRALDLLKEKRGLRKGAADAQTALADKAYDRAGTDQTRAGIARKTQQDADYQDGASEISKRRRAQAIALYPKFAARIDPKVWNTMSAADIDTFLKEAAPEKQAGAAGGAGRGLKTSELSTIRKGLPQGLVDTFDNLQTAYRAIDDLGGWDKVTAGGLGSMTPTMFMSPDQQNIRQHLGRVAGSFLSSGAGKSITDKEDQLLIRDIAGRPTDFAITPQMLQRGVGIIERAMANNARQSMVAVPEAGKRAVYGDLPDGMEGWVNGGAIPKKPGASAPAPEPRKDPNGQMRRKGPDGRWHLVAP